MLNVCIGNHYYIIDLLVLQSVLCTLQRSLFCKFPFPSWVVKMYFNNLDLINYIEISHPFNLGFFFFLSWPRTTTSFIASIYLIMPLSLHSLKQPVKLYYSLEPLLKCQSASLGPKCPKGVICSAATADIWSLHLAIQLYFWFHWSTDIKWVESRWGVWKVQVNTHQVIYVMNHRIIEG